MYNDHALLGIIGSLGVNTEHTEAVSHDIDFLAIHDRIGNLLAPALLFAEVGSKARRNQSNAQNQRDILIARSCNFLFLSRVTL